MTSTPVTVEARAVLFDMDGTLVDSTPVVEGMWGEFAARHDVDLAELLAFSHGRQTHHTMARFLPSGADGVAALAAFQAGELERTDGIQEIPGAGRLLAQLDGARVAMVTSAPRDLAMLRMAAAGLTVPEILICEENTPAGKPDPSGYLAAAEQLGVAAADCVILEDAEAGIQAALASGGRPLVVGAHTSATTGSLLRVPDLSVITATVLDDGGVRLTWQPTD